MVRAWRQLASIGRVSNGPAFHYSFFKNTASTGDRKSPMTILDPKKVRSEWMQAVLCKIQNRFLEKKIRKRRPVFRGLFTRDLRELEETKQKIREKDEIASIFADIDDVNEAIDTIKNRLKIEEQYVILVDHLRDDPVRKYMINNNFYKYLEANIYLCQSAKASIMAGDLTAPPEIYYAIHEIEKCFAEVIEHKDRMLQNGVKTI